MKVKGILDAKGRSVETVEPSAIVTIAMHRLVDMGIGALVVTVDGVTVEGVLSERDLVRGFARQGPEAGQMRVGELMSRNVPTCSPYDTVKHVMAEMTRTRHRHLPVIEDARIAGIVSIGDLVKHRLEELELETNVLRDAYLARR